MTDDELRQVVQGPGDVEWRCVFPHLLQWSPSDPARNKIRDAQRMPTDSSRSSAGSLCRIKISPNPPLSKHLTHVRNSLRLSSSANSDTLDSVCIRDAKEAFSVKPRFPEHFTYLTLDVEDNEEQNLIRLFPG